MVTDHISREVAIKLLTKIGVEVSDGKRRTVARCINEIELLPAADVEPVRHGWWVVNRRCSECGSIAPLAYSEPTYWESPYCPNCGAKDGAIFRGTRCKLVENDQFK